MHILAVDDIYYPVLYFLYMYHSAAVCLYYIFLIYYVVLLLVFYPTGKYYQVLLLLCLMHVEGKRNLDEIQYLRVVLYTKFHVYAVNSASCIFLFISTQKLCVASDIQQQY
jgi:hypothetical protein